MVFDISIAMTWILFLALFPIAFIWLRRAWRILIKRDFSEVALKRGEAPPDPARFAPVAGVLNLLGGVIIVVVIGLVLFSQVEYQVWSAIAGVTIWCKVLIDFGLSRHAHNFSTRGKAGR
jgi:hypothetical protein